MLYSNNIIIVCINNFIIVCIVNNFNFNEILINIIIIISFQFNHREKQY